MPAPFVLLDDARTDGASDARLYRNPSEIVVARRPEEVAGALERLETLRAGGRDLAGYLAYEAGLAIEPRLAGLGRGSAGPLVWFGAFEGYETLQPQEVPQWLADQAEASDAAIGPLEPSVSLGSHARAFARLREAILAGEIYQANLTIPLTGSWSGDPLALYAALRPAAAAGYGGVIHDGSHWLLSFSPELFFALKNRTVTARPMKGTRRRGGDTAEDAALVAELSASPKDRAENLMIVDLMRNDLARIAEPGSVEVERLFAIESYPTVHQMVSTIRARLALGSNACDVLRALFPCGSITGAPKIRAMELIAEVERDARGPYCGAIGRIDASGGAAFNVAIRTLRLSPGENGAGRAVLGVGSAIVADSDAMSEWRECLVKGGFVRESAAKAQAPHGSAAAFDLIETMSFDPQNGIALLDLHLERIRASAAELGFSFDRHAVRNAIQALCFEAEGVATLRLLVARSGAHSLELCPPADTLPVPAMCAVLSLPVDAGDWRLRHKTSDRGFYDAGLAAARGAGAHEALFIRHDGLVTEGCFTNLFVERGEHLLTPPATLGLLPGVLRRSLLDRGRAVEAELRLDDLADGFLIGNARRGLMPARLVA
jgi:para-aminobenzoate synthetase/4-amino-4-deoxychorismate lyase